MLNLHLSYKTPSSLGVLFLSGRCHIQLSHMKTFRELVVPGEECRKEIFIQGIVAPLGVPPNGQSWLRRNGDVMGVSFHATRKSNNPQKHTVRRSISETRWHKHPHLPILLITNDTPRDLFNVPVTEGRDVATFKITGAFIRADIWNGIWTTLYGEMAELMINLHLNLYYKYIIMDNGNSVIYAKSNKEYDNIPN